MNNIKYSTRAAMARGEKPHIARCHKGPSPVEFSQRREWLSMPVLKARILAQGFVLVGKRQAGA